MGRRFVLVSLFVMTLSALAGSPPARGAGPRGADDKQGEFDKAADSSVHGLTVIDRRMVPCLAVDIRAEQELAAVGVARANDKQVKALALQLVQDYCLFSKWLDTCSESSKPSANATLGQPTVEGQDSGPSRAAKSGPRMSLRALMSERGLMRIKTEVAREWVATLRLELEAHSPAEFDRCFLDAETVRQLQMLGTLKVFQAYVSPAVASTLTDKMAIIQNRLDEIRFDHGASGRRAHK